MSKLYQKEEPSFGKFRAFFSETLRLYDIKSLSSEFFGEDLSIAKELLKDIHSQCNDFEEFKKHLNYRRYLVFAMFFVLPLMFFLGVIGFTSEAFILSWFFFTFLFFAAFASFTALYFISSRINRQFLIYTQTIQGLIDKYNIDFLVERKIFAYFRTKSVDSWANSPRHTKNNNASSQARRNTGIFQISMKFKFFIQSRLLRIIRNFFWVEFLRISEPNSQSPEKKPIFKEIEQISPIKKPHTNSNFYQSSFDNKSEKIPKSIPQSSNKSRNISYRDDEIAQNPQPSHESPPKGKSFKKEEPSDYKKSHGSPNVMKFEEDSSENKSPEMLRISIHDENPEYHQDYDFNGDDSGKLPNGEKKNVYYEKDSNHDEY